MAAMAASQTTALPASSVAISVLQHCKGQVDENVWRMEIGVGHNFPAQVFLRINLSVIALSLMLKDLSLLHLAIVSQFQVQTFL